MSAHQLLDAAGRPRSPATMPGHHADGSHGTAGRRTAPCCRPDRCSARSTGRRAGWRERVTARLRARTGSTPNSRAAPRRHARRSPLRAQDLRERRTRERLGRSVRRIIDDARTDRPLSIAGARARRPRQRALAATGPGVSSVSAIRSSSQTARVPVVAGENHAGVFNDSQQSGRAPKTAEKRNAVGGSEPTDPEACPRGTGEALPGWHPAQRVQGAHRARAAWLHATAQARSFPKAGR